MEEEAIQVYIILKCQTDELLFLFCLFPPDKSLVSVSDTDHAVMIEEFHQLIVVLSSSVI